LNFYSAIDSKYCFLEAEVKHYFLVFSWGWTRWPSGSSTAEGVSSEEVFENVIEIKIEWVTAHSSAS
jgi:hypothetical protein